MNRNDGKTDDHALRGRDGHIADDGADGARHGRGLGRIRGRNRRANLRGRRRKYSAPRRPTTGREWQPVGARHAVPGLTLARSWRGRGFPHPFATRACEGAGALPGFPLARAPCQGFRWRGLSARMTEGRAAGAASQPWDQLSGSSDWPGDRPRISPAVEVPSPITVRLA